MRFLLFTSVREFGRILDRHLSAALAPLMQEIKLNQAQSAALSTALTTLQTSVTDGLDEIKQLVTQAQGNGADDPALTDAIGKINALSGSIEDGVAAAKTAIPPVTEPTPQA